MTLMSAPADDWSAVAAAWNSHTDYIDGHSVIATEAMIDAAGVRPGDRLLELGAGPGSLGGRWAGKGKPPYRNWEEGNWSDQGADAGLYSNSDIHAIRILAMEPASIPVVGRFRSHAGERLRILGEIPLRKFDTNGAPILDPEGNPDTSFMAKIPADTPFSFQTIDRDGLMLNMAQTWHQVRPGESRYDCGGCHAHSQQPLDFNSTYAATAGYQV